MTRAGPRFRPIRPLPRPLTREGPKFGGKLFYLFLYKYFLEILKYFSLNFFSLLRRLKKLSNAKDRDKFK